MNAPHDHRQIERGEPRHPGPGDDQNTIRPLPGEDGIPDIAQRVRQPLSRKGLLAVGLLMLSICAVAAFGITRFSASGKKADDAKTQLASHRPSAASTEPRKLDLSAPRANTAAASAPRVPALVPTANELVEPIGVRRTGQASPTNGAPKAMSPEDAPVLLVSSRPGQAAGAQRTTLAAQPSAQAHAEGSAPASITANDADAGSDPLDQTRQNLEGYQRQLHGLLDTLTRSTTAAVNGAGAGAALGLPSTGALPAATTTTTSTGLFGGALQGSATPRVAASTLGNRSLTLPKGTAFTCALKTKVISATSGLVGCQVQRNVFSDDGRVLLIERGSHLDGEYRVASVRPGTVRIPVLWTRIRTPQGVTVDIDSPGTGALGESGIDGYVDNRWGERLGAAMLLSLIDDSVKLVIQNQASDTQANTVVLPSTTANTSKLAEKVLDSTINIPPLIYQNQGGIVGIVVARDVDFSSVYELRPTAMTAKPEARP